MSRATLLVVDDEPVQRDTLAGYLAKQGHAVLTAANGGEALEAVRGRAVDLVLTDMRMPGMDGTAFLSAARGIRPDLAVVVMTAYASVRDAVQAVKAGAADYLQKPIDLDALDLVVAKCLERRALVAENRRLREWVDGRAAFSHIVGSSAAMEEVFAMAARAAASKATVLLRGESGTGKEVLARAIHLAGPRRDRPFVAVNLAALPEALVESELFGHEKGAFTGADRRRIGRFESAEGGTLFIDEVGDIPAAAQVKLLRVLQERTFERVGGEGVRSADVRVIAATHRDLEAATASGVFRGDLYYRLNVVSVRLPPLRERRGDVPALADHFLRKFSESEGRPLPGLSAGALLWLARYDFPGNVRELENLIQRAAVLARGEEITAADLAPPASGLEAGPVAESAGTLPERLGRMERRLMREALDRSGGNQSEAARSLGISERHFRYRMKKYGMH